MVEAARESELNYHTSRVLVVLMTVSAALLSLIMALYTLRSITRPVLRAVLVTEKIADGDLTGKVEASGYQETVKLLEAMKRMGERLLKVISEVRSGANGIASVATQVSATAQT